MAHLRLAISIGRRVDIDGSRTEAGAHAVRALELSRRVPDDERLFIIAWANLILGRLATDAPAIAGHRRQAEAAFDELLERQPDHVSALSGLAQLYGAMRRHGDESRTYQRIGRLRPDAFSWHAQAAFSAYKAGELSQARALANAAASLLSPADFEREPFETSWIKLFPAIDAWLQDDPAESLRRLDLAAEEASTAPAGPLFQFVPQIGFMYVTLGRLDQAGRIAGLIANRPGIERVYVQLATLAAADRGDMATVRATLAGRRAGELTMVPALLLEAGLVDDWRRVNAFTRASQPQAKPGNYLDGLLALTEGRTTEAARLFNAAVDQGPDLVSQFFPASLKLSQLQRAAGDTTSAIATLQRAAREPRWRMARGWSRGDLWIKVRAALAAIYRETGQQSEAEAVEGELRRLLAVADADHLVRRQLDRTP